ncbi:MAG: WD40 repeat domain-containing protein, partial [Phycisphaerae bacterium]
WQWRVSEHAQAMTLSALDARDAELRAGYRGLVTLLNATNPGSDFDLDSATGWIRDKNGSAAALRVYADPTDPVGSRTINAVGFVAENAAQYVRSLAEAVKDTQTTMIQSWQYLDPAVSNVYISDDGKIAFTREGTQFTLKFEGDEDARTPPPLRAATLQLQRLVGDATVELRKQTDAAEWNAYTANLALALTAIDSSDHSEARQRVAAAPSSKRAWEWHLVDRMSRLNRLTIKQNRGIAGLSMDGEAAFTYGLGPDQTVMLRTWRTRDGKPLLSLDSPTNVPVPLQFLIYEDRIVTSAGGNNRALLGAHGENVVGIDPDGTPIALNVRTGHVSILPRDTTSRAVDFTASQDESTYAAIFADNTLVVWDARNTERVLEMKLGDEAASAIAMSRDGNLAWVGLQTGRLIGLDISSKTIVAEHRGHSRQVKALAVSPDGTKIVSASDDGWVRTWTPKLEPLPVAFPCGTSGATDIAVSPSSDSIAVSTIWNVQVFSINPEGRRFTVDQLWGEGVNKPRSRFTADGNALVIMNHYDESGNAADVKVLELREEGGPQFPATQRHVSSILASSPNGPSGLTITTPDGTRRIVGGSDKTVRFYEAKDGKPTLPATAESPEGVYREVAVFRMPDAVTSLQMTGDGTRLIIQLQDGSARVWDIRDPDERRKDLQAEWAERVPAGAYLDALWGSDTPDDNLRDTVINDASLTPLRRLVAAEMLDERLEHDRIAADTAFDRLKQAAVPEGATAAADPASITSAVRAAAAVADLPHRVKARVIALTAEWQYVVRSVDESEQLGLERAKRELAEADIRRLGEAMLHEADQLMKQTSTGLGFTADAPERFRSAARMFGAVFGENDSRALEARAWGLVAAMNASDTERYDLDLVASAIDAYAQAQSSNDADAMRMGVALALIPRYRQAMEWFKTNGGMQVIDDGQRRNIGMLCISIYMSTLTQWGANESAWSLHLGEVVSDCDEFANAPIFSGLWVDQEAALICAALASHRRNETVEALVRLNRAVELRSGSIAAPAAVRISYGGREQGQNALQILIRALVHQQLASSSPESLAAVGEVDKAADPALKAPLATDEHRQRAREALASAKALMQPAADGTPSPWANDEDAKALIAEAEALIGGTP